MYRDESLVSFRCADPDGYAIEIYWEQARQGMADRIQIDLRDSVAASLARSDPSRCTLTAGAGRSSSAIAQRPLRAPNVVEISPQLVTSGQPSADALAGLGAQGFGAVVYLAPPSVSDAVRDEAAIVAGRQGLVYVNIRFASMALPEADFERLRRQSFAASPAARFSSIARSTCALR